MTWQEDGMRQQTEQILKWKRKIKEKWDGYWKLVESFTNDGDILEADHGEAPKGSVW